MLPPLPTVLRSPVTTVAVDAFSDRLSTWHNPSFLSPLTHHVDPDGPAGLVTGLADMSPSPEPRTYYDDQPLPVADGAPAAVQRAIASWSPRPTARSWLLAAPEVDLGPAPRYTASEGAVELRTTDTDPGPALSRVPEPPVAPAEEPQAGQRQAEEPQAQEPPAVPTALTEEPDVPAATQAAWHATPGDGPEAARHQERPLIPDRGPGDLAAQRQVAGNPPPAPQRRRLGLGAPLTDPVGDTPVRAAGLAERPVVARSAGSAALPPASVAPAAPSVATLPTSVTLPRASAADLGDAGLPGPVPPEPPAPAVQPPPAEAPLTGEPRPGSPDIGPATSQPLSAVALRITPLAASAPLTSAGPALSSAASGTVQRSAIPPGPSPSHSSSRSPVPGPASQPAADPGRVVPLMPDRGPADQPDAPRDQFPVSAQRLSADSPAAALPAVRAEVAPLLGHRQPVSVLDALPAVATGARSPGANGVPDAAREATVQRSGDARPAVSRLDGPAMSTARGQAQARWSPSAGYADPGSIAVARGLARRDADGSVVFDLSAPSVPPEPPPPRYEEPAAWQAAPGSWHAVQRQEPAAEPAGAPAPSADSEQTPVTMIPPASAASAATPAATAGGTTGAHPASGAASTPLDELARQLFGPLSARLKAELRLDRERAGLLTDLR